MNIKDACRKWVNGFNSIPYSLIEKAYCGDNIDDITELTPLTVGSYVWSNKHQTTGEILKIKDKVAIVMINDKKIKIDLDNLSSEEDSFLPMWGTMWTFGERIDEIWAEEHLQEMADCGFRIYETEELGILFGIDGAGYDFYESHWIPLYKARGLRWHNED